jgi:hypothetical protein
MAGTTQQKSKKRKSSPASEPAKTPTGNKKIRAEPVLQAGQIDSDNEPGVEEYNNTIEVNTTMVTPSGSTYRDLSASLNDRESLRITLRLYIARDFFPMVKLIVNKSKLAYASNEDEPNSYCARITHGCGIASGIKAVQWWEDFAKREVTKKINQLRSDRMTTLKWAFIGKCVVYLIVLLISANLILVFLSMKAYIRDENNIYRMNDWKTMRKHGRAYEDFYTHFLPCMVGRRKFRQLIKTTREGQAIATVSDEAMTLLGMENVIDTWSDMFDKSDGELRVISRKEKYPEAWKSDIHPKYTATDSEKDPKKWSIKGIERFNELRRLVARDRQKYADFETTWVRKARLSKGVYKKITTAGYESDNMVDADDDFDDDTKMAGSKSKGTTALVDLSDADNSDSEEDDE